MKILILIIAGLLALPMQMLWHATQPHDDVPMGRPRALDTLRVDTWYHLIDPPGFAIGYGEWRRNPLWVSWEVHGEALRPLAPRPGHFRCAENTMMSVCPDDFTRSGYTRGHLAPNYAMSRLYGRAAQEASFVMSNISPQRADLNSRAWQRLEEWEMDYLRPEGRQRLWVMTGPVFAAAPASLPAGIAIPSAFWRLWVRYDPEAAADQRWQALGFVVPQEVRGDEDLRTFVTTVDAIEAQIGFDLLHRLDEATEIQVEATADPAHWLPPSVWRRPPRY